jgi:very-short-patch-repair endonuclease
VENPQASVILTNEANKFAESPFEKSVQADLIREGYKIIPQWKVGAYRIDIVVVGNDKKIAVECDGEKFHSHDKLEEDIYRQTTLERLGWQFIRIRGSEYYKNPILSMNKVFAKLEVLGVEKLGGVNSQPSEERATDQGKDNVLRRAFEIREEWKAKKDQSV